MRVGIIGASGFVGGHLHAALSARGDDVVTASLRDPRAAAVAVRDCDGVVNLAGEPIFQRWSTSAKARIRSSRVDATRTLLEALARETRRPQVLVNASAIGFYPPSDSRTYGEADPHGNDFLGELCCRWEEAAEGATELGMRAAIVRLGIVLGRDGGALTAMLPAFRLGLGGRIGEGKQWFSWVHVDDAVGILAMALDGARGVFNATAPQPVTNAELTRALGTVLRRPTLFAVPGFALRLALGEGAAMLLTGARVLPQRALEAGYTFRFTAIDAALRDLLP